MKKLWDFCKIVWLLFWACLMTLLLTGPIFIASLFSRTGNFPFTLSKIWARVMLLAAGTGISVTGKERMEKGKSYVIISNHQSQFDILALVIGLGVQFRWIIKRELLKVPLFGHALYASRNIFIDRSNLDRARESIAKGVARLPRGASIMVFAEGTRSPDGRLREFKKGGFVIALENNFPVLPVTVNGSRKILPKGSMVFRSGRIDVVVGEPIDPGKYGREDMDELIAATKSTVQKNLVTA